MVRELLRRRVPQILLGYLVGAWGLVEFMQFLELRYALSPAWVDMVGLAVLLLLPAVSLLAWVHGAPGPDRLSRPQSVALSVNVLATLVVLGLLFGSRDLGAVTETVTFENEEGQQTEREVPRADYRRSLANFPLLVEGAGLEDEWLRGGIAYLLELDLSQDPFLEIASFLEHAEAARRAGVEDLSRIPRPLQRQIAKQRHSDFYLWSQLSKVENDHVVSWVLHDTETGREAARGEVRSPDVYTLVDELSLQVRQGLGVPELSFERYPDLPVADLSTHSLESLRHFVLGVEQALWENDYPAAHEQLRASTGADSSFAIAQLNLFGVAQNLDRAEESQEAIEAAMQHLYRVPERMQHLIKASWYFNEQEGDKGVAVLEMWRKLAPEDVLPRRILAQQYELRGNADGAIEMLQEILRLDPSSGETWLQLGELHQDHADFERAEECFEKYVELHPESAPGLISLGRCYDLQGKLDEAEAIFEQASIVEPGNVEVDVHLAGLHAKQGRFEQAEHTYAEALERARTPSERATILMDRTSYFSNRGRHARALEEFLAWDEEAREVYPPVQYLVLKSVNFGLYADADRAEAGLAELRKIREALTPPADRFIAFGEARIHLVERDTTAARAAIDEMENIIELVGLDQLRRIATSYRAWNASLRGEHEKAIELWRESMEMERSRLYQDVGLAHCLREVGRLDEAATTLEQALRRDPHHGRANYEMGIVEIERSRSSSAREHLDRVLRIWEPADENHRWKEDAIRRRASLRES